MLPPVAAVVKREKRLIVVLRTWIHLLQLTSWPNDWCTWQINKVEVVDGKTRVVDSNGLAVCGGRTRSCPERRSDLRTTPLIWGSLSISNAHNLMCNVDAMSDVTRVSLG